jgi:hypothetical protein
MNHSLTPEERIHKAYWQDGSVDLFTGIALSCLAIAWIFDLVALGPIAPPLAMLFWVPFRRRVVEPRLGHVQFDQQRQGKIRKGMVTMIGIGCFTLALGIAAYVLQTNGGGDGEWIKQLIPGLPASLIAIGALISAVMFEIPRLAYYALPFMAGGAGVILLECDPGWGLLGGGLATTAVGAILIARFLRNFPVLLSELE